MRRQADEMTLASHRYLQRLANPPRCVGRQTSPVAHVKAIDGLHQTADGFLEQVGIAQRVMPKALGDVGRQADVRRGQSMLQVYITIVQTPQWCDGACLIAAVIANE